MGSTPIPLRINVSPLPSSSIQENSGGGDDDEDCAISIPESAITVETNVDSGEADDTEDNNGSGEDNGNTGEDAGDEDQEDGSSKGLCSVMFNKFVEYMGDTSAHGMPNIVAAATVIARVFWILTVLFSFAVFFWQTSELVMLYVSRPVTVYKKVRK